MIAAKAEAAQWEEESEEEEDGDEDDVEDEEDEEDEEEQEPTNGPCACKSGRLFVDCHGAKYGFIPAQL